MELSPTAKVILGFLGKGPRSGYEIKQSVEASTRFFWAASYGQIYPELRRLEAAGLVRGEAESVGARPRRVFHLTEAGMAALRAWLRGAPEVLELRHEGMLGAFFAGSLEPGERAGRFEALAEMHERRLADLEAVSDAIGSQDRHGSSYMVLQHGIAYQRWAANAGRQSARQLAAETSEEKED